VPRFVDEYLCRPEPPPVHPLLKYAKPCPFCCSSHLSFGFLGNFVHCDTCGADGPEIRVYRPRDEGREERARRAVAKWNTRHG
jgi:uncharacterized protein (DUF983 family)